MYKKFWYVSFIRQYSHSARKWNRPNIKQNIFHTKIIQQFLRKKNIFRAAVIYEKVLVLEMCEMLSRSQIILFLKSRISIVFVFKISDHKGSRDFLFEICQISNLDLDLVLWNEWNLVQDHIFGYSAVWVSEPLSGVMRVRAPYWATYFCARYAL